MQYQCIVRHSLSTFGCICGVYRVKLQSERLKTMLFKALVLGLSLVAAASAAQCSGGNNVPQGQPCRCADHCLGGSQCLHDGQGGTKCLCLPCEYFEDAYGACVPVPEYGDDCHSVCASNFQCLDDGAGGNTCQCSSSQVYDSDSDSCIDVPGWNEECTDGCQNGLECIEDGESSTGKSCQCVDGFYDEAERKCTGVCIKNVNKHGCVDLANGDYPVCFPRCRQGIYVTCSHGYLYIRDCAKGWYQTPGGPLITEKMVYDPAKKACERKVAYCPRYLDNFIFG